MNSKKAITLLVLVSMLVALVPVIPASALAVPTLSAANGAKGTTIEVTGALNDVPAGTVVELYWDDTTIAWNGVKGKLNSTTAKGSGNYEIWFDVPEAKQGTHYVWIKSVSTGETKSVAFTVDEKVSLSATSGLRGDKIDVDAYGQASDKDIAMVLVSGAATAIGAWPWTADATEAITVSAAKDYDGTVAPAPVAPGTFVVTYNIGAGAVAVTDDGAGAFSDAEIDGTINYVTGEWEITFATTAPTSLTLDCDSFVKVVDNFYLLAGSGTTSAVGSASKRVTIPNENVGTEPANGAYSIQTLDAKGNTGLKAFTVGAVITVSPDSGATGDLVTVKGRGFTPSGTITYGAAPAAGAPGVDGIALSGVGCMVEDYGTGVAINAEGEFTMSMYIPEMGDEDDYSVQVSDGFLYAEADYEVTALAEITVTPDYGPQGQSISISGVNFPNKKDTTIAISLIGGVAVVDVPIKNLKTNADGSISGTFRVPAEVDDTYEIEAAWANVAPLAGDNIVATETFRIGSVLVLLSDDSGPAGLTVTLSGNGFTATEGWNATFGDETIFEGETVAAGGLLKDGGAAAVFFVPQVDPGVYDVTVLDEDTGIEVVTQFTVTDATSFALDPAEAPSGYNVTLTGTYWSEDQTPTFEFWLYNSTDEWDITALVGTGAGGATPFMTGLPDDDYPGDWEAWWVVGTAAGDLDMGTYTLNITYGDDWFMESQVVVGDEHISASPRKATFKIGDTVSFNIEHSFGNVVGGTVIGGVIKIYDPSGNLFWETDGLNDWTKSGMYYYVPAADQLENGNPLVLLDDAPLGEWTYKWYENNVAGDGDLIEEGTFMVAAAAADVVSGQVADLANDVADLSGQLSDVTGEFADVQSSIADVSALAADAVAAANAAADAVTAVAATANTASEAAADAADAANAAREAASGLTTLVYGAIGAALVAALAAIVSLMQISRRIAG